jgi:hypothetical protein
MPLVQRLAHLISPPETKQPSCHPSEKESQYDIRSSCPSRSVQTPKLQKWIPHHRFDKGTVGGFVRFYGIGTAVVSELCSHYRHAGGIDNESRHRIIPEI